MQTRENRIYRHFLGLKKRPENGMGPVWMTLARRWRMPIQEVKRIVREEKARQPKYEIYGPHGPGTS